MITDGNSLRLEIELQSAAQVQLPQVMAGFLRVLGDGECVLVVVQQRRIFVRERENGRRLGGHDRCSLAARIRPAWIRFVRRSLRAGSSAPAAIIGMPACNWSWPNEDRDAVVPHHGD